ncbi:hypothetical protein Tco_0409681 [Tanacetum coccineum]
MLSSSNSNLSSINSKIIGTGYSQKDKNKAKTDKTKHGNEKSMKSQSKVNQKVNKSRSQSQPWDIATE